MEKIYVVCYDRIWKDKLVCICQSIDDAEMVEAKWKSHSEKTRVRIVKNEPRYEATWYHVSQGKVVKTR